MVNKRFELGILLMVLVFGMTVSGCKDGTTNNPFEGTSWYLYNESVDNHSSLDFYNSTWTWYENLMYDENGVLTYYDFKGTYTYKDNVATMLSTHYRLFQSEWIPWSGKWTATLTGNNISIVYDRAVNPIILLHEQIDELRGYRNIK